jgi:hypothetical protein
LRLANVAVTNFDDLATRVQLPSAWEHRFLCTLPELSPGNAGFRQWSMPIVSRFTDEVATYCFLQSGKFDQFDAKSSR